MAIQEKVNELKSIYSLIRPEIHQRLAEFQKINEEADNRKVFEELSFCILSSGVGPRMAEKSVSAMGNALHTANVSELVKILKNVHKYPDKASYLVAAREYIKTNFNYDLLSKLKTIHDRKKRRDFMADNKAIRGIGMVQASHFLRNIGFTGYAMLDRNILGSLLEFGVIDDDKPPSTKKKYLEKENNMIEFSEKLNITIDELDLLLWYRKNNKIPR